MVLPLIIFVWTSGTELDFSGNIQLTEDQELEEMEEDTAIVSTTDKN